MGASTSPPRSVLGWAVALLLVLVSTLLVLAPSLLPIQIAPLLHRWDDAAAPLGDPVSGLSPSGQVLLKRCEDSLGDNGSSGAYKQHPGGATREGSPIEAAQSDAEVGTGAGPTKEGGGSPSQGPAGEWLRWHPPHLLSSWIHSDFGWIETRGLGTHEATVGVQTCFTIAVMTRAGHAFDRGCLQRMAFMANMSSVEPQEGLTGRRDRTKRLAPDVTYLPHSSTHEVCYVAPTPGSYRLDVSFMFTNAFQVMTSRQPSLTYGYVNYTTAVSSQLYVSGPDGFSLVEERKKLPACTLKLLADSKSKGFWLGDAWLPAACRIRLLEPAEMVKCLNGKSVLFLGDSEMRFTYGVLQTFLSMNSRGDFLLWLENHSWHPGSLLERMHLPARAYDGNLSTLQPFVTRVHEARYSLATGDSAFYGGRYEGFGVHRLRYTAPPRGYARGDPRVVTPVDGNLTYVGFFHLPKPLIPNWMRHGSLTGGVKAGPGRFDLVLESALLHSVKFYDSRLDYGDALNSTYIPKLKELCPEPRCTLVSFGAWAGDESRKPRMFVGVSNNVRQHAFEEEGYSVFREHGFPFSLPMWSLTAPQRGGRHALDPVHYRAPVTQAMIDMVFGSLCSNSTARAF